MLTDRGLAKRRPQNASTVVAREAGEANLCGASADWAAQNLPRAGLQAASL